MKKKLVSLILLIILVILLHNVCYATDNENIGFNGEQMTQTDLKEDDDTIYFVMFLVIFVAIISIGLYDSSKNKKKIVENKTVSKEITSESKEKMDKLISLIKERTETTSYKMICEESQNIDIFSSKLGGLPYWNLDMEYPTDSKGNKMPLLAQINFEKEKFDDERLPNEGILQFFVATDDLFGANFEKLDEQKDWRAIYHKKIDKNVTERDILDLNIPTSTTLDDSKEEDFPFTEEFLLKFEKHKEYIGERVYNFEEIVKQVMKEEFNEEIGEEALYKYFTREEDRYLTEAFNSFGDKTLGYPAFTQEDPRMNDKYKRYDTLLLQIDSAQPIMWGDDGVANFFINSKDLENRDFSKILYNWDCY